MSSFYESLPPAELDAEIARLEEEAAAFFHI